MKSPKQLLLANADTTWYLKHMSKSVVFFMYSIKVGHSSELASAFAVLVRVPL